MYDNIRPLNDSELPEAIRQITASPLFEPIAHFLYPNEDPSAVVERLCALKDIHTMQDTVMRAAIDRILSQTVTDFTHSGTDMLLPSRPYLFISNHRDITLMQDPIITLIGRANRMFRVERGGTPKEFYRNMLQVSQYIRQVIVGDQHSVWIAQRNGRTKDGLDRTEVSLLKMLALSGRATREAPLSPLKTLNIVPVSISYEWEPCDLLKAHELHMRSLGPYRKAHGEDMNSVLTGILQPKGRVHIEVCEPISEEELQEWDHRTNNEYHKNVAQLIDHRINSAYRLYANNYIAHDLLYGQSRHRNHYDEQQREAFLAHAAQLREYDTCDQEHLYELFLGIYANPVDTHIKACR